MNKLTSILFAILLVMVAATVQAQDKKDMFNPVNTSVTSQTIAPDARAAGMGDVGVATDADVNSQYWNPAKYPLPYRVPEWRSTIPPGCDSWSTIWMWPISPATTA